eukprot:3648538-Prymnesium_polylepis.1
MMLTAQRTARTTNEATMPAGAACALVALPTTRLAAASTLGGFLTRSAPRPGRRRPAHTVVQGRSVRRRIARAGAQRGPRVAIE